MDTWSYIGLGIGITVVLILIMICLWQAEEKSGKSSKSTTGRRRRYPHGYNGGEQHGGEQHGGENVEYGYDGGYKQLYTLTIET